MDFIYTEEQRMLADSLRRLVAQDWTQARRRKRQAAGTLDAGAWDALAGLGVLGLNIAENCGGFGEPPASLLPVHLELGRGLVSEPVIPSAVMGAAWWRLAARARAGAGCRASPRASASPAWPGRSLAGAMTPIPRIAARRATAGGWTAPSIWSGTARPPPSGWSARVARMARRCSWPCRRVSRA